jgi:hypothetical protein
MFSIEQSSAAAQAEMSTPAPAPAKGRLNSRKRAQQKTAPQQHAFVPVTAPAAQPASVVHK